MPRSFHLDATKRGDSLPKPMELLHQAYAATQRLWRWCTQRNVDTGADLGERIYYPTYEDADADADAYEDL